MTIADVREKCKNIIGRVPRDVFIIIVLVLASSFSFGLGYLAGLDAQLATQESPFMLSPITTATEGQVVASKTGTKYYLPSCAAAGRISDANKIWFVSAAAAEAANYTPAANCTGL